ncbi:hypothetical protein BC829DRAFT_80488 [Chytridium lagenaria]|nr:hypothetical protein BC829DRAFT_80488 [Chytridium lagenaria]
MTGIPIVLVACKVDLRMDASSQIDISRLPENYVSKEEGQELARLINAVKYVETSALTGFQVDRFLDDDVDDSATPVVEKVESVESVESVVVEKGVVEEALMSPTAILAHQSAVNGEQDGEQVLMVTAKGVFVDGKPRPSTIKTPKLHRPGSISSAITESSLGTSLASPVTAEALPHKEPSPTLPTTPKDAIPTPQHDDKKPQEYIVLEAIPTPEHDDKKPRKISY